MNKQVKHNWITIIIPAAGLSLRMAGKDKLTMPVGNSNLLKLTTEKALSSMASEVIVVTGKTQHARNRTIDGLGIKLVHPDSRINQMSVSIITGLRAVNHSSEGILILLPDMPLIETADINKLIENFHHEKIIRATNEHKDPGHPVLFPKSLFPAIMATKGDNGPREVIAMNEDLLKLVKFDNEKAMVDVDTPESWGQWVSEYNKTGAGEGT
ncbi:MAG: nucleotidyltransferase family protein [Rhodobacteraceae bacterium]|nr:nucleotidyltransferase family protein [Paracoccaceae bacterium]